MRKILVGCALACAPLTTVLAQGGAGDTTQAQRTRVETTVPPRVARDAVAFYNASGTQRVQGTFEVASKDTINGDLAVLDGDHLTISGRVRGRVIAINTDVRFVPGGRIDGDLMVFGAAVTGADEQSVSRGTRIYHDSLRVQLKGTRLVSIDARGREEDDGGASFLKVLGHTYNRVEGLPIELGPTFLATAGSLQTRIEVHGIIRSADGFDWNSDNLGHKLRFEQRSASYRGFAVGGTLYDVVEPVETWQLKNSEVGLASFLLHRDYRDYYNLHGGSLYASVFSGSMVDFTVSFADERWATRAENDPWTLFRSGQAWRPNPAMDDGSTHVLRAALRVDTRNDEDNPWSGWLARLDVERGSGHLASPEDRSLVRDTRYSRAFVDIRRYNRISPHVQLNMRVVWGGQLPGGALPLERRLSMAGPGAVPGFDFREDIGNTDVAFCHTSALEADGPAACQRIALAQIEYRGPIGLDLFGSEGHESRWRGIAHHPLAQWVVFADAGRGWLLGPPSGDLRYGYSTLFPALGTFRTDVGGGLDVGNIGFYIAKSVSNSKEPANFFVRLHHRF